MRIVMLVSLIVIMLAGTASAYIWDPELSRCWTDVTAPGGSLLVCPCGDGHTLAQMYNPLGGVVDGTIHVELLNLYADPMVNYPAEDIWLTSTGGNFAFVEPGTIADHATDMAGHTEFVEPLAAGGHRAGSDGPLVVYVAGTAMLTPISLVTINSPDINGDLRVDLTDVTLFATDYVDGYANQSDLVRDGVVNLADLSAFATHIGHNCP